MPVHICVIAGPVKNRCHVHMAEVLPRPLGERFDPGADGRKQKSMHSQPRREGHWSGHRMVTRTHLRNGCVTPHHSHNPFVQIPERRPPAYLLRQP